MNISVKDGGTWRTATAVYVKDGGVWRTVTAVYVIPVFNVADVSAGILQAATNTNPGKTLFKDVTVGGRMLGDITNSGTITSADALAYTTWADGVNADASQVAWIEGTLNPYMLANPVAYAAYVSGGSWQQVF
jgi:hypothetical protein